MENTEGLKNKYFIQKVIGKIYVGDDFFGNAIYKPELKEVDKNAEYFVLRLDDNSKDKIHLEACRKAILVYAEEIKNHLPELSKDLTNKYS